MYEEARRNLVAKLRSKGVSDERVLQAVGKVERHRFVPEALRMHAYVDRALPISQGQTISQPYTVAFMTEKLRVEPGDKILEIGTGSAYQAAILHAMGAKVYTVERNHDLYERALARFDELDIRAHIRCGDGTLGWSEFAPFDGVIVTAGAPKIPKSLRRQLAVGGRIVCPVGDRETQSLAVVVKLGEEEYDAEEVPAFKFVPLIGREGWSVK